MLDKSKWSAAVNADGELTHLAKVVLLSMIAGAVRRGGHWEFSQHFPAWCFSIDLNERGLRRMLGILERDGHIERLSARYARKPRYKILFGQGGANE